MSFNIYNTLSRRVEEFQPLNSPHIGFYTCGQTVYYSTHIGHLKKYTGDDFLRRTLEYLGYQVKHVQNVTDVGHLVSDADDGEDKMEKGARKAGKTVWEVAKEKEEHFYGSLQKMNVLMPHIVCRATEHIDSQIKLVQELMDKGFAYETEDGVYFDVMKFPEYGKLSGQKLEEKWIGAGDGGREKAVRTDLKKRSPYDFALWVKRVGEHANHTMHWDSPWGDGFPGWHIECSAMSMQYLGETIDIHTGGVDHIAIHHPNEIAQSEASTGKQFVRYWVHHEFLNVDGQKMSQSLENFYTIEDIVAKGFEPLAFRYFLLTAHYRQHINFTWEALQGAQNSLNNLRKIVLDKKSAGNKESLGDIYIQRFKEAISDDLNMPKALAVMWETAKDPKTSAQEILEMDKVFGLKLDEAKGREVPKEVLELARKIDSLRSDKKFDEADALRKDLEAKGYLVKNTPSGTTIL